MPPKFYKAAHRVGLSSSYWKVVAAEPLVEIHFAHYSCIRVGWIPNGLKMYGCRDNKMVVGLSINKPSISCAFWTALHCVANPVFSIWEELPHLGHSQHFPPVPLQVGTSRITWMYSIPSVSLSAARDMVHIKMAPAVWWLPYER